MPYNFSITRSGVLKIISVFENQYILVYLEEILDNKMEVL